MKKIIVAIIISILIVIGSAFIYLKFNKINESISSNKNKLNNIKTESVKEKLQKEKQQQKQVEETKLASLGLHKVYKSYNLEIYVKDNQAVYNQYKDIFDKQLTGKYMMCSGKIIINNTNIENGNLVAKFDLITKTKDEKNLVWNSSESLHYIMGNNTAPKPESYQKLEGNLTNNGVLIPRGTKYFYITVEGTIYKDYLVEGPIKSNYNLDPTVDAKFDLYQNNYIPFDKSKAVLFNANVSNIIGDNINTDKGWVSVDQNGIIAELTAKKIDEINKTREMKSFVSLRQYPSEYSEIIYQSFKEKKIYILNSMENINNSKYYYVNVDGIYGWVTSKDLREN
ncbi:hypothetical protein [uncultured Clostridium sp.]|jgi:uncharacterized protein YxeA|uniref:hypothetical protein n=1 Tax=uncultured Clostridium sp. TaxID=59620 RepID=UPI002629D1AD|nr:hypothetical protein [uncultured Clostridium sp.]